MIFECYSIKLNNAESSGWKNIVMSFIWLNLAVSRMGGFHVLYVRPFLKGHISMSFQYFSSVIGALEPLSNALYNAHPVAFQKINMELITAILLEQGFKFGPKLWRSTLVFSWLWPIENKNNDFWVLFYQMEQCWVLCLHKTLLWHSFGLIWQFPEWGGSMSFMYVHFWKAISQWVFNILRPLLVR